MFLELRTQELRIATSHSDMTEHRPSNSSSVGYFHCDLSDAAQFELIVLGYNLCAKA
jgi:hypothetical protein